MFQMKNNHVCRKPIGLNIARISNNIEVFVHYEDTMDEFCDICIACSH